jgi:hypothetical protein
MRGRSARYFAHEYLNAVWNPLMFADVQDELTEAKCTYICSATLVDNLDFATVPTRLLQMFNEIEDPRLRETVRDFTAGQTFRRDIYRRGVPEFAVGEHIERLGELSIAGLSPIFDKRPEVEISCAIGKITGAEEVYRPILAALASGPMTFADVQRSPGLVGKPRAETLKVLTLLVAGGYAHPISPDGRSPAAIASSQGLNLAIARHSFDGGDTSAIAAPLVGTAIHANVTEQFIIGAILSGTALEASALARAIKDNLDRTNRKLTRENGTQVGSDEMEEELTRNVGLFIAEALPYWRSLGILA